jgi:hypothetical protein
MASGNRPTRPLTPAGQALLDACGVAWEVTINAKLGPLPVAKRWVGKCVAYAHGYDDEAPVSSLDVVLDLEAIDPDDRWQVQLITSVTRYLLVAMSRAVPGYNRVGARRVIEDAMTEAAGPTWQTVYPELAGRLKRRRG